MRRINGTDEIAITHRKLIDELTSLIEILRDREIATRTLTKLQNALPRHFALEEERDGLLSWVVMVAPHLGDAVDDLLNDHRDLNAQLAALKPHIGDDGLVDDEARIALVAFLKNLRDHERAETLALNEASKHADVADGVG